MLLGKRGASEKAAAGVWACHLRGREGWQGGGGSEEMGLEVGGKPDHMGPCGGL